MCIIINMSDTAVISFRNDIVELTCNLSGMLLKIGCIDHYERLKAIVEDTMSLSNITELIQILRICRRFSDTLPT